MGNQTNGSMVISVRKVKGYYCKGTTVQSRKSIGHIPLLYIGLHSCTRTFEVSGSDALIFFAGMPFSRLIFTSSVL